MLERVGLPKAKIFDALRFIPYFQQPVLVEEGTESFLIVGSLSHFHYSTLQVYLRLSNGQVWIDDPQSKEGAVLANSDVFGFKSFLDLFAHQIIQHIALEETEIAEQRPVAWLESRFKAVDPLALEKQTYYWRVFLNEMKQAFSDEGESEG